MPPTKKKKEKVKDETYYVTVRTTFTVTYTAKSRNEKALKTWDRRESQEFTFRVKSFSQIALKSKQIFEDYKRKRMEESPVHNIKNVRMIQKSRIKGQTKGKNALIQIRMKDCAALTVDGWGEHEWDTKTGHCVYDWLIHTYGNIVVA